MDEIEKFDFSNGDEFSDFKLIVENQTIFVHKAILASVSPVFRKMFTCEFKENLNNEAILPEKRLVDILCLLKLIYPNYEKNFDDSNVEKLLQLSDEYNINSIKLLIEKNLISQLKSPTPQKALYGKAIDNRIDFVCNLQNLSEIYCLKRLKTETLEYLSSSFSKSQLEGNSYFMELNETTKLEIYRKKLDLLEEKLKLKEDKLKKLQDECLKQKFELRNLEQQQDDESMSKSKSSKTNKKYWD